MKTQIRFENSEYGVYQGNDTEHFSPIENSDLLKAEIEEIRKYSITPTTFDSREFVENSTDQWFIDNYEYNDNNVIRFGINTYTLTLDDIILEASEDIESKTEIVSRNIRSSSSSSTNYKAIVESIIHTCVEKTVFERAVHHLLDNEDKKTVLVDILARDQHTIQMNENYPESHTLVLYKNPVLNEKHEIFVIDPSNFIFSSHLSNKDIVPSHYLLDKITVLHKKDIQIYSPKGETGPLNTQYRDCIDLSVKIAFGLNNTDPSITLDLKEVKNWDIIKDLSNNKRIDTNIIHSNKPVRIKQTSDSQTIYKFNLIEKSIFKILGIVDLFDSDIRSDLENQFSGLLEQIVDDSSLTSLAHHYETCIERLYEGLNTEKMNLIGLIEENSYEG